MLLRRDSPMFYRGTVGMRRAVAAILATATVAMGVAACATSPLGRSQLQLFDAGTMADMGAAAFQNMQKELETTEDRGAASYVDCIAKQVLSVATPGRAGEWEVRVFASDERNAFALPGGKIGVYEGMIEATDNQSQLAAVIAHEVAHVLAEHGNERLSTSYAASSGLQLVGALMGDVGSAQSQTVMALLGLGTQVGVILPFSRAQEREADLMGIKLMAEAGFDPAAAIQLWQKMASAGESSPPEFLSTHPSHGTRIDDLQAALPAANQTWQRARTANRVPNCERFIR